MIRRFTPLFALLAFIVSAFIAAPAMAAEAALTSDEIDGLLFMREEEKLAHDVYMALYDEWGVSTFYNIAQSEQAHTEAVQTLLLAYGIDDPAANTAAGEFINEDLQTLYDDLVAQGSESLEAGLRVGAAIEEIDILDLEARLAETSDASIAAVYTNLMRGSESHLRAFVSTLDRQFGVVYEPEYLEATTYEVIISGSNGNGNNRGGNGNSGSNAGSIYSGQNDTGTCLPGDSCDGTGTNTGPAKTGRGSSNERGGGRGR